MRTPRVEIERAAELAAMSLLCIFPWACGAVIATKTVSWQNMSGCKKEHFLETYLYPYYRGTMAMGTRGCFGTGKYNIGNLDYKSQDEGIYSIKLNQGNTLVVLFDGDNFSGDYLVSIQDIPNLDDYNFGNKTSSLYVQKLYTNELIKFHFDNNRGNVGKFYLLQRGIFRDANKFTLGSYSLNGMRNFPAITKPSNYCIQFFEKPNYRGHSYYIPVGNTTISNVNIPFKIHSIAVFKGDRPYLYTEYNLLGDEAPLEIKDYANFNQNSGKYKSISIPEGYIVFLYNKPNFEVDARYILSAGAYNLPTNWTNHVKSMRFFNKKTLLTYSIVESEKAKEKYLKQNPDILSTVKITEGYEKTEYNIVAKNENLNEKNCYDILDKSYQDLGVNYSSGYNFVCDFYMGEMTFNQAKKIAEARYYLFFGFKQNFSQNINFDKEKTILPFFGGYRINNDDPNGDYLLGNIYGCILRTFTIPYRNRKFKTCVMFANKAEMMNKQTQVFNDVNCQSMYKEKIRLNELQKNI